jgi:hypothetical protein
LFPCSLPFCSNFIALSVSCLNFQIYDDEPSEIKEDDDAPRIIDVEKVL